MSGVQQVKADVQQMEAEIVDFNGEKDSKDYYYTRCECLLSGEALRIKRPQGICKCFFECPRCGRNYTETLIGAYELGVAREGSGVYDWYYSTSRYLIHPGGAMSRRFVIS